jgi:hypothetical protein
VQHTHRRIVLCERNVKGRPGVSEQ